MATNILKIFNKITNSWESVSGVGIGADPSSPTGTVDLTNYYKKNETYSKSEIDTKVASAGNFDASQYYPKTEVYSKSEVDTKIPDVSTLAKKSETYNKSEVDEKVNFAHQNAIVVTNETMLDNIKLVKKSIAECAKKESTYDKNQIDNKLNNYVSKGLLLKCFDIDKEKYTFMYEYNFKRKEKNTLEIKLPHFIENCDLQKNFVFLKIYEKFHKYGGRIFNSYNPINIDGKEYITFLGENTSHGIIFPYSEEIFEDKKYTEYLYTILVSINTEIPQLEVELEKIKNYHKKIVRVKIEQTNIFNETENTITIRIELKNLEEYTKDYEYPENELLRSDLEIDFSKLDKNAFRKIEEDPDFIINTYETSSTLDTYFAIVPNDVKEIFENKKETNKNSYIFKKCFKLNLENSTGIKISKYFDKETTIVEDENNAKLSDVLRKYKYPSDYDIDEDCLEITTTSNFDDNYEIIEKEITTNLFTFKIKNKNDNTIRILKIYDYSFHNFKLDNLRHNHRPTFEADYHIMVTNPIKYEDFEYMYHFIDTNNGNYNYVSESEYNLDLYPKVVLKSFYVGRYITKETEEENKLNSLIDSKIPNLSEYVKNNYTATDLQLNTNVKIKGTLQKDNSEAGDPDEDYITTKYFGENFPVFFDKKINTIAAGSVDNFVLKNQKYTSPAYTFTEKTNEVSLAITDNFKQFNNFVITFTDTPDKLVLSGPQIGQSGVIKVINAKKINGYDSNLKSTVTLPVLDKLNDTEYFSYYVFSESEILFSRI